MEATHDFYPFTNAFSHNCILFTMSNYLSVYEPQSFYQGRCISILELTTVVVIWPWLMHLSSKSSTGYKNLMYRLQESSKSSTFSLSQCNNFLLAREGRGWLGWRGYKNLRYRLLWLGRRNESRSRLGLRMFDLNGWPFRWRFRFKRSLTIERDVNTSPSMQCQNP